MYSLDVNFLKDRNLTGQGAVGSLKTQKAKQPLGAMIPLYAGLGVMVVLPALAGGAWFLLNNQKTKISEDIKKFEQEIQTLNQKQQKIKELEAKLQAVDAETQALASVFTDIKPWSAILEDIKTRVPRNVQLKTIQQGKTEQKPESNEQPKMTVTITGFANTYNDINDFLLMLKRSSLLNGDETKLQTANLVDNPTKVELPEKDQEKDKGVEISIQLPKVVEYTIVAQVTDTPASKLVSELKRKGAIGLPIRLETLEQKGVIKP